MQDRTKCWFILWLSLAGLVGFFVMMGLRPDRRPTPIAQVTVQRFDPPTISYEGRTPIGPKLDLSTVSPVNAGYTLDMDGDGVPDFTIMDGNTLRYAKSRALANLLPILVVKGTVVAYFMKIEENGRPALFFWNDQHDGFVQRCLGVNPQGIPYFGEVEEQP